MMKGKLFTVAKFPGYTDSSEGKVSTWSCSPDLCKLQPINEINKKLSEIYGGLNPALVIFNISITVLRNMHMAQLYLGIARIVILMQGPNHYTYLCQLNPHFPNICRIVNMVYAYC